MVDVASAVVVDREMGYKCFYAFRWILRDNDYKIIYYLFLRHIYNKISFSTGKNKFIVIIT